MKHCFKIFLTSLLILLAVDHSSAQQLDTLKNWRIHKLIDREAFKAPEDSLPNIPSRLLQKDFLVELGKLETIDTKEPLAIMTSYLLSFEDTRGRQRKVLACGVGNYIFIDLFQKYWAVPAENRKTWTDLLDIELQRIP